MRLAYAIQAFLLAWPTEGPRSPSLSTVRSYSWALKWFEAFCLTRNKVFVRDVTPELLRAAIRVGAGPHTPSGRAHTDDHHARNWQGGTAGAYLVAAAVRRMAKWLEQENVAVHDLSCVRAPRAAERIQPRVTPQEFTRMESAILRRLLTDERPDVRSLVARDLSLISLLADTGLRAGEVVSMTTSSVDLSEGWVQVRGKGSKERALSIRDPEEKNGGATMAHLAAWLEEREKLPGVLDTSALWLNNRWRPMTGNTLREVLQRICHEAGVEGNRPPHTFRRSHFSEAYRENPETVKLLAARMGWSPKSHQMVDVYTRGANIELTRLVPVPLVSKRLRHAR